METNTHEPNTVKNFETPQDLEAHFEAFYPQQVGASQENLEIVSDLGRQYALCMEKDSYDEAMQQAEVIFKTLHPSVSQFYAFWSFLDEYCKAGSFENRPIPGSFSDRQVWVQKHSQKEIEYAKEVRTRLTEKLRTLLPSYQQVIENLFQSSVGGRPLNAFYISTDLGSGIPLIKRTPIDKMVLDFLSRYLWYKKNSDEHVSRVYMSKSHFSEMWYDQTDGPKFDEMYEILQKQFEKIGKGTPGWNWTHDQDELFACTQSELLDWLSVMKKLENVIHFPQEFECSFMVKVGEHHRTLDKSAFDMSNQRYEQDRHKLAKLLLAHIYRNLNDLPTGLFEFYQDFMQKCVTGNHFSDPRLFLGSHDYLTDVYTTMLESVIEGHQEFFERATETVTAFNEMKRWFDTCDETMKKLTGCHYAMFRML